MILRARAVLPISQPPLEDGAVRISRGRIRAVGRWKELSRGGNWHEAVDLGDTALMPGLVNAHCHLDYTNMAGLIPPQKLFTDWIKLIMTAKAEWSFSEFAESWLHGARMLARTGTTTVADFEAVPELLPDVWTATPLRVLSFLELTVVKSRRDPRAVVREALARVQALPRGRSRAVLAPHAPYSTVPALLRLCAQTARRRRWPLSIHIAESAQESDMFARAGGGLHDWLQRNGRDMSDCGLGSPVQHLERAGMLGSNLLAVHANYLGEHDAQILGENNVSVAHCPRSHFYFQHRKFPFAELTRAHVNVCLGTDSLATVFKARKQSVELSLFDEMRAFARAHPRVAPRRILQMATLAGARALGQTGEIGELAEGARADLIAVPFAGGLAEVHDALVHHRGDVAASMVDGRWTIPPKASAVGG